MAWLKKKMLEGVLDGAAAVTNVAVPGLQAAGHAVAGGAAAAAHIATHGQVGADFRDSEFKKMHHATDNMEAGLAEKLGRTRPHFCGSNIDVEEAGPWMKDIPDTRLVTEMFIPGSHDSMSYGSGASFVQTQVLPLEKQLAVGLRAFDIRVKHDHDVLKICHGAFDLGFVFADVVKILEEWIAANPSEMLAVSLSCSGCGPVGEHAKTYHEALQSTFTRPELWVIPNDWPSLGSMRGKIMLASRGRNFYGKGGPIAVQNNYKESDQDVFLTGMCEFCCKPRDHGVLYANWMNAVGLNDDDAMANVKEAFQQDWAKSPAACAYQINKGALEHIATFLPCVFYLDFPGVDLIKIIRDRNF